MLSLLKAEIYISILELRDFPMSSETCKDPRSGVALLDRCPSFSLSAPVSYCSPLSKLKFRVARSSCPIPEVHCSTFPDCSNLFLKCSGLF